MGSSTSGRHIPGSKAIAEGGSGIHQVRTDNLIKMHTAPQSRSTLPFIAYLPPASGLHEHMPRDPQALHPTAPLLHSLLQQIRPPFLHSSHSLPPLSSSFLLSPRYQPRTAVQTSRESPDAHVSFALHSWSCAAISASSPLFHLSSPSCLLSFTTWS